MSNKIILGIDPGYDRLGWAVGRAQNGSAEIFDFGCIMTKKTDQLEVRYQDLEAQLQAIINQHHPQVLAIETLFFSKNISTALQVSETRGIIISVCYRHQLEIKQHNPNTIKLTVTGDGRADKKAVEKMVRLQLKLPTQHIIDDAIDALAIVLTEAVTRR